MELHGERSSNFPYIASAMRQLPGGSGTSYLSFSLAAAEPAGLQPAATTGHPWHGVAQAPGLLRTWWQRARGKRSECKTTGKPLCSPHQRGEMVSDASPPYPGQSGGVGCVCIGAPGGNGPAWGEGGQWVAMLSSRPTALSPLPEAQLQQSEQRGELESLSPLCHLHTPHRRQWHSNLGSCSTADPLRNSLPSSASCHGPGLHGPAPGGHSGDR